MPQTESTASSRSSEEEERDDVSALKDTDTDQVRIPARELLNIMVFIGAKSIKKTSRRPSKMLLIHPPPDP